MTVKTTRCSELWYIEVFVEGDWFTVHRLPRIYSEEDINKLVDLWIQARRK